MTTQHDRPLVSRTYRAAIRIGEDFITLEETITLPLDATDDDISQASELGWRIYLAQRTGADATIADVRRDRPGTYQPAEYAAPLATEKQIAFIRSLAADLDWTDEQLAEQAGGRAALSGLPRDDASALIELLKKETREERIIDWSRRVSGAPEEKPGIVGSVDIPF